AADPRGFRLDQAEDHLHGDRGVERAAAELQHRVAGFGGERMRRGHHESLGGERFSRIGDKAEKKKGGRDRPSQKRRYRRHQTIKGTISSATMLMILMSGLTAGPAVSLWGSPTVSPVTAALCASEPLPPSWPSSMYFLALSQAPPEFDRNTAMSWPVRMTAARKAPRAR